MAFVQLTGGAYTSRSLIAAAQRCLNLFPEETPKQQGEPIQVTHYCTPGLTLEAVAPQDTCRCLYTASNGDLWAVYGQQVLWYSSAGQWHVVGTLTPTQPSDALARLTPVSMADNGTDLIIVDGSVDGWTANVQTHDGFANINYGSEPYTGFYGADYVSYQDTFFLLNKPGTPIFYISGSVNTTFDPLDANSITSQVTECVAAISVHRNLWLLGKTAFEIWINNGGSGAAVGSFPFTIYPEAMGNWGVAAKYSIASTMNELYWLSQDKFGHGMVMRGQALTAHRISTHAIEVAISEYPDISDAIGYCYQQQGHVFYVLTFPSAHLPRGATWVYDGTTGEWHERAWIDNNGLEYRHLSNACASAYGKVYCGDWRNGNLYSFDLDNYTDNGQPIKRLRSFPHQIDLEANRRIMFTQAIIQMQVGGAGQGASTARVIQTDFDADDGTLLQDFSDINSIGATFTSLSGIDAVILGDLVTGSEAGSAVYQASGTPDHPDYYVQFNAVPSTYDNLADNNDAVFVRGRASATTQLGYEAGVYSNSTDYLVYLDVLGGDPYTEVVLGALDSGYYTVTLSMVSTKLTVSVQRSEDGLYVDPNGNWVGSPTTCIQMTDTTYQAPGVVLIGGTWS